MEVTSHIKDLYEQTLIIPEKKGDHQFLLCAIGLIGAGKTTVLKPLCEKLGVVRMCTDDIRKLLKENGFGYDTAQEINVTLVRKYLGLGYSVAIDGDSIREESQKLIEETRVLYGVKVVWIHINPPEAFIVNKLTNFKHSWLFRDAEHALSNYYNRKPLHEHLSMPFLYTFDTSKSNLADQIEEASQIIEQYVQSEK